MRHPGTPFHEGSLDGWIGGRSPGFRAFPPRLPGPRGQWLRAGACERASARSQWRARAGFSPASLSTDPLFSCGGQHSADNRPARLHAAARPLHVAASDRSREPGVNPGLTRNGMGSASRRAIPSPNTRRGRRHKDPVLANGRSGLHRPASAGGTETPPSPNGRRSTMMRRLTCAAGGARDPASVHCWCRRSASATSTKARNQHPMSKGVGIPEGASRASNRRLRKRLGSLTSLAAAGSRGGRTSKVRTRQPTRGAGIDELVGNEPREMARKKRSSPNTSARRSNAYAAGIDPARVSKTQNLIAGSPPSTNPRTPATTAHRRFNGHRVRAARARRRKDRGGVQRCRRCCWKSRSR